MEREVMATGPQQGTVRAQAPREVKEQRPSLAEQISDAEQALVMATFVELKKRGDGELRIAVKRRGTLVEIVYAGVAERADLTELKTMYDQLRTKGQRF